MYGELSTRSFSEILNASSEKDLMDRAAHHVHRLGFKSFTYRHRLVGNLPSGDVLDGNPVEWSKRYAAAGYLPIDPRIQECRSRIDPLCWREDIYLTERAKLVREEARDHGLIYGISCPVHDRGGAVSVLCLGTDEPFDCHEASSLPRLSLSQLVGGLLHTAMENLRNPRSARQASPELTAREREALHWVGHGKTNWEIAQILAISERTVIFHLGNAVHKLGANNRVQAVVVASACGLI